jgi:hypothetical protein
MDLLQIAKKERAKLDRVIALLEDKEGMASLLTARGGSLGTCDEKMM